MASIWLVVLVLAVAGALAWTVRVLVALRGVGLDPAERYRRDARALRAANDARRAPAVNGTRGRDGEVWEAGAEPSKAKRLTAGFLAGAVSSGCGGGCGCGG